MEVQRAARGELEDSSRELGPDASEDRAEEIKHVRGMLLDLRRQLRVRAMYRAW